MSQLGHLMLRDEHRLRRRMAGLAKIRSRDAREAAERAIHSDIEKAARRVADREARVPRVTYPTDLPIVAKLDEIKAAISDNQVVIVAGETGSGKTTQLPKICLELGRGIRGMIGHTQPRRIAARTVAERIAAELQTPVGQAVGWKVRFTDRVSDQTFIKVMTDGIVLAEIHDDRALRQYDTLIIDEAHERSLNIDFILGYVKQLLPRRPDLKVIITSATIDPERFSRHFDNAPVIEVSGRTYPVEVRYRPIVDDADDRDRDQIQAICDAVTELQAEPPGDILVFLSGEREIRDTADALARMKLRDTEILPLYARLASAEQQRVFQPHRGRRIVLATNVAETSLTVPGIKYVIDPGTARTSRYSNRLKVQRLPIEPISQASANQRAGRCGRTSDGICIRLYSEADYLSRPKFTEPEILRTNLASVILAMTAAELGDIAEFPFLDRPDHRNIKAGIQLLEELGALDTKPETRTPRSRRSRGRKPGQPRLTPLGRKLAQLPIDPRFGRMVLEAAENGCLREVLVIAAALSIQDPRERPADKEQAAAQAHARFVAEDSDFLTYLNLWNYLTEQQQALSSNQFRKLCKAEFLNYLRVREWQDIESQLRQIAESLQLPLNTVPADPDRIHRSLLAGLLAHIGMKDPGVVPGTKGNQADRRRRPTRRQSNEYRGARGARFAIFPGSALFKKPPDWIMAAELVETSRLWAREVAKIEPEWVESLAQHLVLRSYSEPHWSRKQNAVLAYERVTLYGVPLVANRRVNYGRIDPVVSRELFIRHALVEGDWDTHHEFFHKNRKLLEYAEDLERRARRRDIVVDDETLFEFYDRRIGPEVVSGAHFDSWWRKVSRENPHLLDFSHEMLVTEKAEDVSADDYPDHWEYGDLRLRLSYQFEPGSAADGVTVHIPLPVLNQVEPAGFDWQVPGLREDLVTALIGSLPKTFRRSFVPAPDYAREFLRRTGTRHRLEEQPRPLVEVLSRELRAMTGVVIPLDAWNRDRVPNHLVMTFAVHDDAGRTLAEGKDLQQLKRELHDRMSATLSQTSHGVERSDVRTWDFGELPQSVVHRRDGYEVKAFPALTDEAGRVAIRLYDNEVAQRRAMRQGLRRLLLRQLPSPVKHVLANLTYQQKVALGHAPHARATDLFDDCLACAVDALVDAAGGPVWNEEGFRRLVTAVRANLHDKVTEILAIVSDIVSVDHAIRLRLESLNHPRLAPTVDDVRNQLAELVFPGFVAEHGYRRLGDILRYLRAIERRLEKAPREPERDQQRMDEILAVQDAYRRVAEAVRNGWPGAADAEREQQLEHIRWMIEELRVSYFAQMLRTQTPVSVKRIQKALDAIA